ncbi:hypothetical protein [Nonomuraea sp. NPDC005692]|uniref:hypothetical protein n=1 Tax=Nonomuraea sp. NPDC005692 TaxID=3157168 RepID=UPI0033FC93EE
MSPAPDSKREPAALPADLMDASIESRSDAKLFGSDMHDPGISRVLTTISIYDFPEDYPNWVAEDDKVQPVSEIEGIGLNISPLDTGSEITIFHAQARVLDLGQLEDPYETLDADSQELEAYGCLFDLDEGGLHPDLESRLMGAFYSHIVILERVRLAPAWRGKGGVGRYLTARALPMICPYAAAVALQPYPLDVKRHEDSYPEAVQRVQRTWRSLGFEPYSNSIWVLDPNTGDYERTVARLEAELGLS